MGEKSKNIEPRREKTSFLYMRKQRRRSASRLSVNREADQRLCLRYTDSTIPLLPKSEISSLSPFSEAVQPGLCQAMSKTRMLVFSCRGSVGSRRRETTTQKQEIF